MIYLDTSCLLKLLVTEPDSDAVREAVAREDLVVVSSLAELARFIAVHLIGCIWRRWKNCASSAF